ncbi:MAG: hypothetical protein ACUBOA_01575 [Candidatus Loosdrechtia sp.]|nr:MAG: hypothetical protein QY305_07210 [Candidatus Jettenia sp. AMX2]
MTAKNPGRVENPVRVITSDRDYNEKEDTSLSAKSSLTTLPPVIARGS